MSDRVPQGFDHLMFGGRATLEKLSGDLAARSGVVPGPGGRHTTGGTHNALLGLGGARYLEIIAADPEGDEEAARSRLIAGLPAPRNVAWAVAVSDLDRTIARARAAGYDPGPPEPLSRRTAGGGTLAWRLAWRGKGVFLGILPFLIEWGSCPHPAAHAPAGLNLIDFFAEHPDPPAVRPQLDALGIELTVAAGRRPALVATLETPSGRMVLR